MHVGVAREDTCTSRVSPESLQPNKHRSMSCLQDGAAGGAEPLNQTLEYPPRERVTESLTLGRLIKSANRSLGHIWLAVPRIFHLEAKEYY